MPVSSTCPEYDLRITDITTCRDVSLGEREIKANGETYLTKLDKQTDDQYTAYKSRARFLNVLGRTVHGLVGLVFRKDPVISYEDKAFIDNVTGTDMGITAYSQEVMKEVLTTGNAGTLIDYIDSKNTPVWKLYQAEKIINWRYESVNGEDMLTMVVLEETYNDYDEDDEFEYTTGTQYRVLELDDDLVYKVRIYREQTDNDEDPILVNTFYPTMDGTNLDYLPFVFHDVEVPPLLELANACVSFYQLKADHAHGLHYIALPTPYILGVDSKSGPNTIGPQEIWKIPDIDAKVGMLEYTGAGIKSIAEELTSIKEDMILLGARIIDNSGVRNETKTAAMLRHQTNTSLLAEVVNLVSAQLSKSLNIAMMWDGDNSAQVDNFDSYKINTDFLPNDMEPNTIIALIQGWQTQAISKQTMFEKLQEGEVIPPTRTFEKEQELIQEAPPPLPQDDEAHLGGTPQGAEIPAGEV